MATSTKEAPKKNAPKKVKQPRKKYGLEETNALDNPDLVYRCICCGKEVSTPDNKFYKLTYSPIHKGNNGYAHICNDCIREEYRRYYNRYGAEFATIVICHYLNVPFYRSIYMNIANAHDDFNFGYYVRQLNTKRFQGKTFALTLYEGEITKSQYEAEEEAEEEAERNWTLQEKRAKNEVIKLMGYDPFAGYRPKDRKVLFVQMLDYLGDDDLLSDNYKLAQVIQIINNNNQINQYDVAISKCDVNKDMDTIETYNNLKRSLVQANEKIAKENGISVNSRGGNTVGKGTLTGLMRDMRDKDFEEVEVNFYDQLKSESSRWAADVSMRSMMENCAFDENDVNAILEESRELAFKTQEERDALKEQIRLMEKHKYDSNDYIETLKKQITKLGGTPVDAPWDKVDLLEETESDGDVDG